MKTLIIKTRSHKRHFQLLELMIAAFILLICIAPTMRIFTNIYLSQQAIMRENQRDHLIHLVHAHLTEQLYKRTLSLEDLKKGSEITLNDTELSQLLTKYHYAVTGTFTIINWDNKKGEKKPTKYLGKLIIKIKDISPKPTEQIHIKNAKNQNPFEIFYDYSIYINSGKIVNKNKATSVGIPSQQASSDSLSFAQSIHFFKEHQKVNI